MPLPIRRLAATALLAILVLPPAEPARAGICDGAVTQLQINECFHQKFLKADRKLNKAWPGAQRRAERMGTGAALRDAQRKWIAFRDATCSAEAGPYQGGSMQASVWSACLERLTKRRTKDLRNFGR